MHRYSSFKADVVRDELTSAYFKFPKEKVPELAFRDYFVAAKLVEMNGLDYLARL